MRARTFLAAAAGAVGAATIGNRLLSRRAGPLGPPLDHETGTYRWRGLDIAYTEGGDPEATDLLLVHGMHRAGTSREFDRIFGRLTDGYHVLAPDLPGFGRSDRPPLRYSAPLYQSFLRDFVEDVTDAPVAIGSGLGGAFLVATSEAVGFDRLVLVCPTRTGVPRDSRALGGLVRSPLVGEATFNAMTSGPALRRFVRRHLVYDPDALAESDRDYLWESAHQPGARFAPAGLYAGQLAATRDIGDGLAAFDGTATLIWGRAARFPSLQSGRELADRGDVKLVVLDQARALPHFEQPAAFFDVLGEELEHRT